MQFTPKHLVLLSAVLCFLCSAQSEEVAAPSITTEAASATTSVAAITTTTQATTSTTTTAATTAASTTAPAPAPTTTVTTAATPPKEGVAQKKYYISNDIPTCQQKDANINDCIKKAFELMLPRLKHGNKDLNVPSLDPFTLNRTTYQYTSGPINGRIAMRNAQVFGFGDTQIKDVDFKLVSNNKTAFRMTSLVPAVKITGLYKADVSFNNIRMKPRGSFNVTMTNVSLSQTSEGSIYDKDGHRFVRLINFDVKPEIAGMKINATGLFPDTRINDIVLNFANQYWREIYRIMLPETRQYWGPMLLDIINESLATVPFDLLITDNRN